MSKFRRVQLDNIAVGTIITSNIADPNNTQIKLLGAGVAVTQEFIEKLRSRGVSEVMMSNRDAATMLAFEPQGRAKKVPPAHQYVQSILVNDVSKDIDQKLHDGNAMALGEIDIPVADTIERHEDCTYEDGLREAWASERDEQLDCLTDFFQASCEGSGATIDELFNQCETILKRVREDMDALVCLAGSPFPSDYPTRHAIHLASMAIAIGVESGLDHQHLMDLGLGCLIHDIGMQRVGVASFETKNTIGSKSLQRLADHPVKSVEIAGKYGDRISENAKIVAYQIHERLDGSGYPRGRSGNQIHELAKIAAVADSFVGMITPRPHRLGIQGFYAIKQILEEVKLGKLDPKAVRGLLKTTSLYPIGSYVELTNDNVGRVIRSGGDAFDKPTIEMWPADGVDGQPAIVNLLHEQNIQITNSIASPKAA